jgi:hypothetical protein
MALLLLVGYSIGIASSRLPGRRPACLTHATERAVPRIWSFRVLTSNQQPDHNRIGEFRRRNLDVLSGLFVQIPRLCLKTGMVSRGLVAEALIREAERVDAQEDGTYGKGNRGRELPKKLQRRDDRLEKIRQVHKALQAETAAVAVRERQKRNTKAERSREKAGATRELAMEKAALAGLEPPDLEPLESDQMPRRGLAHQADGSPTAKTQRIHRYAGGCAYTDPDSHIMKENSEIIQAYNCHPPQGVSLARPPGAARAGSGDSRD